MVGRVGAWGLAGLLAASACATTTPCPEAKVAQGRPAAPAAQAAVRRGPRFSIAPDPAAMVVVVTAEMPADVAGAELVLAEGTPTTITASDAAGEVPVQVVTSSAGAALRFGRALRGALTVGYRVRAGTATDDVAPKVEIDGEHLRAMGRSLLALPAAFEGRPREVELRVKPWGDALAATSFGVGGERVATANAAMLRDALFVTGKLGHAQFDSAEGQDDAAWTGYTAFDPRPIAADVAAFRTAAREAMKEKGGPRATLLIVADKRPSGRFVASRRAESVVVNLGPGQPWTGALRIAVAAEILKRWIGGEVRIGRRDGTHELEGLWFAEGVARSLARSMSFRFGVVTPAELLDEMHGLEATALTSRLAKASNAELAARVGAPGVVPLLVARGALYGARTEALLRRKSGGKRGLEDVVRAMLDQARKGGGPLPESAWVDALRAELGDGEAAAFQRAIVHGEVLSIGGAALGPCFAGASRRYAAYDPGFDVAATRAGTPRKIVGLAAGGTAARAGLAADDVLVDDDLDGRASHAATLTVERSGARRTVKYTPAGAAVSGEGWTRKQGVADDACAR